MRWITHTDFEQPVRGAVFDALTAAGLTVYENIPPGDVLPYVIHDDIQQTEPLTRSTCPALDVTVTLRAYSRTIPEMRTMLPAIVTSMTNGALDAPLEMRGARISNHLTTDTFIGPDDDPTGLGDDTHPVFARVLVFQYTVVSLSTT